MDRRTNKPQGGTRRGVPRIGWLAMVRVAIPIIVTTIARRQSQLPDERVDMAEQVADPYSHLPEPQQFDVKFFLRTKAIEEPQEIKPWETIPEGYNPNKKIILIAHGFLANGNAEWVTNMAAALLGKEDANIIAIDWSEGCKNLIYYRQAAANIRTAAAAGAELLAYLDDNNADMPQDKWCIGHSLGAHTCGHIGKRLKNGKLSRITGLDPAGPCFKYADITTILNEHDADFVDTIHTNGMRYFRNVMTHFGMMRRIGHADFYPNGGKKQPQCDDVQTSPEEVIAASVDIGIPEWTPNCALEMVINDYDENKPDASVRLAEPSLLENLLHLQMLDITCDHTIATQLFTKTIKMGHTGEFKATAKCRAETYPQVYPEDKISTRDRCMTVPEGPHMGYYAEKPTDTTAHYGYYVSYTGPL